MSLNLQIQEIEAIHLPEYVSRQLKVYFPNNKKDDFLVLREAMPVVLQRLAHCFCHINIPAYVSGEVPCFSIMHSDQYATFLYLLANEIFIRNGPHPVANKVFYLNKVLHAFNCMYDVELPPVFLLIHLVGTVLGKARFGNYLVVRQGCTVGALRGEYPTIGDGFIMSAGSSIIGPCKVGDGVMLAPSTVVMGVDIPPSTLVSGHYVNGLTLKPLSEKAFNLHFKKE